MTDKMLEQLAAVDYPVKVYFEREENLYVAEFLDLPGCKAYGVTVEEAYQAGQEAKKEWLSVSFEQGFPIPKPSRVEEHSGRILLRLPSSLHSMLVDKARINGSSLNQYIVHLVSGAVIGDHMSRQIADLKAETYQLERRFTELAANVNLLLSQANVGAQYTHGYSQISDALASNLIEWAGVESGAYSERDVNVVVTDSVQSDLLLRSVHGHLTNYAKGMK